MKQKLMIQKETRGGGGHECKEWCETGRDAAMKTQLRKYLPTKETMSSATATIQ